jgi:hypothetical protein
MEFCDLSLFLQVIKQGLQAQQIAPPAEAADLTKRHRRNHRAVAKLFARVDVAEVHLNHRQLDGRHRVAQRV